MTRIGKIGKMANAAVPFLLDVVDKSDGEVRRAAACSLAMIAEEETPDHLFVFLSEALLSYLERSYAIEAFSHVGKKAIPALLILLNHPDYANRRAAVKSLGNIASKDSAEAISLLIEALQDQNRMVQEEAVAAVGKAGEKASAAIPLLCALLNHPYWHMRELAARALGKIGKNSNEARVALHAVTLQDDTSEVRKAAAKALQEIESE